MRFLLETTILRGELLAFEIVHLSDKSTTPSQYWLDDHLGYLDFYFCQLEATVMYLGMPPPFPVAVTTRVITFCCRGIPFFVWVTSFCTVIGRWSIPKYTLTKVLKYDTTCGWKSLSYPKGLVSKEMYPRKLSDNLIIVQITSKTII